MRGRPIRELEAILLQMDGRGYKAYREIKGEWGFPDFLLSIDHVQGDPFAAPTRASAFLEPRIAQLPPSAHASEARALGTACLLARRFLQEARSRSSNRGTGKSGEIRIEAPDPEVLPQTAVQVDARGAVEARFTVGLPARGRRVLGKEAIALLAQAVPAIVRRSLRCGPVSADEIVLHAEVNEDAEALRKSLPEEGLIAFVADGALLPRKSGVSQEPLGSGRTTPFRSPDSMRRWVELPNAGRITGMGVPRGVTLIVGGGYHGKSTLLRALERGVYNHRPGDGRERVVSDGSCVKIRAEDGRSVEHVDISPFIGDLPTGEDTRAFSSANASGSTSQAANIMEAVEAGASALLIDEDTAATNFMIRDRRMQALVPAAREPITPFVDRVQQLATEYGISSVLVLGGSGDYLDVADTVIAMADYRPQDVSDEARAVAASLPTGRKRESRGPLQVTGKRVPLPSSLTTRRGRKETYLRIPRSKTILLGTTEIDLAALDQLISWAQARSIGRALLTTARRHLGGDLSLPEILGAVEEEIARDGLDALETGRHGDLAWFRRFELSAAFNRIRTLEIKVE